MWAVKNQSYTCILLLTQLREKQSMISFKTIDPRVHLYRGSSAPPFVTAPVFIYSCTSSGSWIHAMCLFWKSRLLAHLGMCQSSHGSSKLFLSHQEFFCGNGSQALFCWFFDDVLLTWIFDSTPYELERSLFVSFAIPLWQSWST